jgi:hypothetical protein
MRRARRAVRRPLLAGETGLVELVLASSASKHGDRLVLRDHALERTVGGGTVVAIHAPQKAAVFRCDWPS